MECAELKAECFAERLKFDLVATGENGLKALFLGGSRGQLSCISRRAIGWFASWLRLFLRIPEKATTLSGAWRPRDPVDDDQGGARA
jgi:hypothetical protein